MLINGYLLLRIFFMKTIYYFPNRWPLDACIEPLVYVKTSHCICTLIIIVQCTLNEIKMSLQDSGQDVCVYRYYLVLQAQVGTLQTTTITTIQEITESTDLKQRTVGSCVSSNNIKIIIILQFVYRLRCSNKMRVR